METKLWLIFKIYPFAQHKSLLGPFAFEGQPEEKGDSEGDEGDGDVHVGDGDVLPDHWPDISMDTFGKCTNKHLFFILGILFDKKR